MLRKALRFLARGSLAILRRWKNGAWFNRLPEGLVQNRSWVLATAGETVLLGGIWVPKTLQSWLETVGPNGRVIAVEANPESAARLRREFSQHPNLTVVNKALLDKPSTVHFAVSETNYHGWDCIVSEDLRFQFPELLEKDGEKQSSRTIEVDADSIDNILEKLGIDKIDHITLTINACELLALRGASKTMQKNKDMRIWVTCCSVDDAGGVFAFLSDRKRFCRTYRQDSGSRRTFIYASGHERKIEELPGVVSLDVAV